MNFNPNRGTGRTTRQIEALPDGAAFVVAHNADRRLVHDILRYTGRGVGAVTVLIVGQQAEEQLKSRTWTAIDVDHAVRDDRIMAVAAACRVVSA